MTNLEPSEGPRLGVAGFLLVILATVTLVTVLGSLIGFYSWMWALLVLGGVVGLWVAARSGG